mgnify:CR=1 FL=1
MANHRIARTTEDVKRELTAIFRELKDPRIGGGSMLTVIRCDVSNDGSYCKVYISSLEGYEKAKEAVKGLTSASGYLKREISNVLKLRKCPDLKFVADNSAESSVRIFEKLKNIQAQQESRETQQED